MFTGLIQRVGRVREMRRTPSGARIRLDASSAENSEPGRWDEPPAVGESVAVQGVCLTVTDVRGAVFVCDLLSETIRRTNLGRLRPGDPVNLERALRTGDPLGGHFVTGHVDGTGTVTRVAADAEDLTIEAQCAEDLLRGIVPKGSVAVDGVSLTVAAVGNGSFRVAIIPFTRRHTTLGMRRAGDAVNIETDILGKHARKSADSPEQTSRITPESLARAGYL